MHADPWVATREENAEKTAEVVPKEVGKSEMFYGAGEEEVEEKNRKITKWGSSTAAGEVEDEEEVCHCDIEKQGYHTVYPHIIHGRIRHTAPCQKNVSAGTQEVEEVVEEEEGAKEAEEEEYVCDHKCGFRGGYALVEAHEARCEARDRCRRPAKKSRG